MLRNIPTWALVLCLSLGCGGDAAPVSGGDSGSTTTPEGGASRDIPENTVLLTRDAEGALGGMGVALDGVVHFYAEELEAYWTVNLSEEGSDGSMTAPAEVRVVVDDERQVTYTVVDPTGQYAPIFFGTDLPEAGSHDVDVNARALLEMDEPFFEADLTAGNPFDDFFVSVTVGTAIRAVLISVATAAALSVLKSFVVGVCEALLPLHRDTCEWVGLGIEVASLAVAPGFQLKFAAWAGAGGARMLGIDVLEFVAGKICDQAGVALEAAVNREDAGTAAMRNEFRRALTYYNYLLWRLGESPPAAPEDVARLRGHLEDLLPLLLTVGPAYREGYTFAHHPSLVPSYNELGANGLSGAIGEYIKNPLGLPMGANLTLMADQLDMLGSEVVQGTIRIADSDVGRAGVATFVGCSITIVNKVFFANPSPGPSSPAMLEADPTAALAELADFLVNDLATLHMTIFGEGPPDVTCLADVFEPNGDWRSAHVRPHPGEALGLGSALMTESLTLCGIGDMPVDEDWYAFPVGPISWRAEARIFNPPADETSMMYEYDPNQRVCMEMYWYAQTNELAGVPPTLLRGACGTVNSEFSIGPLGVRGTAGETFRQILIRVYAEDRSSMVPVRYSLGFAR